MVGPLMKFSSIFRNATLLITAAASQSIAAPKAEFIFDEAPFPSAHASNIVELKNGDLLASWFGGTKEGARDVAIWGSRKHDGKWSPVIELAREPNIATYNPVIFYTKDGKLWLYYKFGPHPTSWSAGRRSSTDDGKTWSWIEHLPAGLLGPVRTKPLMLSNGTIVSGTSIESYHTWACWIERSTDNGKTWATIGPITVPRPQNSEQGSTGKPGGADPFSWNDTYGIIQPSVVAITNKHLRLYARSTANIGKIVIADSKDAGQSWSEARTIDVPNPNSGIDIVRLRDGRFVLIYNNTPKGRSPLNLAVSKDGISFKMFNTLESEPGEYSYPALIQGVNEDLHMTYTWNRKKMKYVHLTLADIPTHAE